MFFNLIIFLNILRKIFFLYLNNNLLIFHKLINYNLNFKLDKKINNYNFNLHNYYIFYNKNFKKLDIYYSYLKNIIFFNYFIVFFLKFRMRLVNLRFFGVFLFYIFLNFNICMNNKYINILKKKFFFNKYFKNLKNKFYKNINNIDSSNNELVSYNFEYKDLEFFIVFKSLFSKFLLLYRIITRINYTKQFLFFKYKLNTLFAILLNSLRLLNYKKKINELLNSFSYNKIKYKYFVNYNNFNIVKLKNINKIYKIDILKLNFFLLNYNFILCNCIFYFKLFDIKFLNIFKYFFNQFNLLLNNLKISYFEFSLKLTFLFWSKSIDEFINYLTSLFFIFKKEDQLKFVTILKSFNETEFLEKLKILKILGFYIKFKGKIGGFAGSRKKNFIIKYGKYSKSNRIIKNNFMQTNISTFNGIIGLTVSISYF